MFLPQFYGFFIFSIINSNFETQPLTGPSYKTFIASPPDHRGKFWGAMLKGFYLAGIVLFEVKILYIHSMVENMLLNIF